MRDINKRIIKAATEFHQASFHILMLRRRLQRCTERQREDRETGDYGVPPCFHNDNIEADEWCEPCRDRKRIYEDIKVLKRQQHLAKVRLLRAVEGANA